MDVLCYAQSLIYGEVDYHSFYRVLRKINPPAGGTFYDLGSGTGKAVFAARLTCDFDRCLGIEILEGLHKQATVVANRYILLPIIYIYIIVIHINYVCVVGI
jgi:hypothetical protein